MIFTELPIPGAYLIAIEQIIDERGFFARSFCKKEFDRHGLESDIIQCNVSFNLKKGTLRGLHYQRSPKSEAKLINCLRGKIFDVILDLRTDSPTFHNWYSLELSSSDGRFLYIPKGLAHGFQAIEKETTVSYAMFHEYSASHSAGILWNDPKFGIDWPIPNPIISERDKSFPLVL